MLLLSTLSQHWLSCFGKSPENFSWTVVTPSVPPNQLHRLAWDILAYSSRGQLDIEIFWPREQESPFSEICRDLFNRSIIHCQNLCHEESGSLRLSSSVWGFSSFFSKAEGGVRLVGSGVQDRHGTVKCWCAVCSTRTSSWDTDDVLIALKFMVRQEYGWIYGGFLGICQRRVNWPQSEGRPNLKSAKITMEEGIARGLPHCCQENNLKMPPNQQAQRMIWRRRYLVFSRSLKNDLQEILTW